MQELIFKQYELIFDPERHAFKVNYTPLDGETAKTLVEATISVLQMDGKTFPLEVFTATSPEKTNGLEGTSLSLMRRNGPSDCKWIKFSFFMDSHGVRCSFQGNCIFRINAQLMPGWTQEDLLSVHVGQERTHLRACSGPATSDGDNALFDRQHDFLLKYECNGHVQTQYDWDTGQYQFSFDGPRGGNCDLTLSAHEGYMRNRYNLPYRCIRKRPGFETPSVGWMTWYAVKFDASEAVVLENAAAFMKHFKGYMGDARPVMWVDWEWCHKDLTGLGEDGCDMLHPRKNVYPNGLKAVSDKLRKMGLLPALWVAPTNDCRLNPIMKAHPDWVLCQSARWCGQYWFDLSNPDVLKGVIPRMFKQYLAWGYEALKWDCIPMTLWIMAEYREKRRRPDVSPMQIFREMVTLARKTIGENHFMLSCSGVGESDIEWNLDGFDGARIGGDIFTWEEFVNQGIGRILHFYPLHNTAFYIDADNLVLRKTYSNLEQARTRISIYGLSGIPITLGDAIKELDAPRIEMLKRIMPVVDIRPGDLERKVIGKTTHITRLAIARRFGQWTVAAITNLTNQEQKRTILLNSDLDLADGEYAVYDFWNRRFVGCFTERVELCLKPFDTVVLRITPKMQACPTLLSLSRHITQGGFELVEYKATSKSVSGTLRQSLAEPCTVTLLLPEGKAITKADAPFVQDGQIATLTVTSAFKAKIGKG